MQSCVKSLACAAVCAFFFGVCAVTYEGKALDGEWVVASDSEDVTVTGKITGTGDIRLQSLCHTLFLNCTNEATGNIYVDRGYLNVVSPYALGTATVYNDSNDMSAGEGSAQRRIIFRSSMVVTNAFVLGDEDHAGWSYRLGTQWGAHVTLTGPLTCTQTKVSAYESDDQLVIAGGVKSSGKAIFEAWQWNSSVIITNKPVEVTGPFWFGGYGKVYLTTVGNAFTKIYCFNDATLVCGCEGCIPEGTPFSPQHKDMSPKLDLNGYSQVLGSLENYNGAGGTFTILNSRAGTCPSVTIRHTGENTYHKLKFSGVLGLVKEGAGLLNVSSAVNGDVTVRAGTLRFVNGLSGNVARNIVIEGGVLDLDGQTLRCRSVTVRNGGAVSNGTLKPGSAVVEDGAVFDKATLDGKVTVNGSPRMLDGAKFANTETASRDYDLPEGTVLYYPLDDSLEQALHERSGLGPDLTVSAGAVQFADAGHSGGCLYFDGKTYASAKAFPVSVPSGASPVTVSTWIKFDPNTSLRGGWVSYGRMEKGKGSSIRLAENFTTLQWYANDVDVNNITVPNLNDGAWHNIVLTWDGENRRVFCDGALRCTSSKPLDTGTDLFQVGKTMYDVCFTGWLDEVLVLDRALDADEVAALTEKGVARTVVPKGRVTVASGDVRGYDDCGVAVAYPFDSAETFLNDASATGATLSNHGAVFTNDTALGTGGAVYFDGSSYIGLDKFPAAIPIGNAPRSVLCFAKLMDGAGIEAAFVSYGVTAWVSEGTAYKYCNLAMRSWPQGGCDSAYTWCVWVDEVSPRYYVKKSEWRNRWVPVVAVYKDNKASLYVDGILRETRTTSDLLTPASGFMLGKAYYDGSSMLKGCLDEVAICNRALTDAEVYSYGRRGVSALTQTGGSAFAADSDVAVAQGATVGAGDQAMTLAGLSGGGTVQGDVVIAEGGALEVPTDAQTTLTVTGTLTLPKTGVLRFPAAYEESLDPSRAQYAYTLVRAGALAGAPSLAGWTFANAPKGYTVAVSVADNAVVVTVTLKGFRVLVR